MSVEHTKLWDDLVDLRRLRSTDLIAKDTWLLPTPLLETIGNTYSEDVICLMGWDPELELYVGESAKLTLLNGGDPDLKAYIYWQADELAQDLNSGWWTLIDKNQARLLVQLINAIADVNKSWNFKQKIIKAAAADVPPGYKWELVKPAEQIWALVPKNQLSSNKWIGAYQPNQDKPGQWKLWQLKEPLESKTDPTDLELYDDAEPVLSETEARAAIIIKLQILDSHVQLLWPKDN